MNNYHNTFYKDSGFGAVTVDKAGMVKRFDDYCAASQRLHDIITGATPETGCFDDFFQVNNGAGSTDRPVFGSGNSTEGGMLVDNSNHNPAHGTETFSYNKDELTGPEAAVEYNQDSDPGIAGYYKAVMSDAEAAAEYNAWLDGLKRRDRAVKKNVKLSLKGRARARKARSAAYFKAKKAGA